MVLSRGGESVESIMAVLAASSPLSTEGMAALTFWQIEHFHRDDLTLALIRYDPQVALISNAEFGEFLLHYACHYGVSSYRSYPTLD